MKKTIQDIKRGIFDGFWNIYNYSELNEYSEARKLVEGEDVSINELASFLHSLDIDFPVFHTGIITTKKKFCVIKFIGSHTAPKIEKTNTFFEIENKDKKDLSYGRYAHGIQLDDNKIYIQNIQPKKYCCTGLKREFALCDIHGLNCPDNFIRHTLDGRFYVEANGNRAIGCCPFCGTKFPTEDNYQGLFLML